MLVLVSFGLVLLATILLVVGLLTDDGLNLIYLSIACSVTAAVVLYLAFRRARPERDRAAPAPEPLLADEPDDLDDAASAAPPADVTAVQPAVPEPAADPEPEPVAEPEPVVEPEPAVEAPEPVPVATSRVDDWVDDDDWADAGGYDLEFPIADYDELTVDEIMPLLPQLYSDELDVVAERERSTKGRAPILDRLAELAATGTAADATEGEVVDADHLDADLQAPVPDPDVASRPERAAAPAASTLADDGDDAIPFPIADYDELSVDQILPLLAQLEADELEDVKDHEVAGQARKTVIAEIDHQLAPADAGDAAWQPAPAALAIEDYDRLTVAQIRPQLAGLGPDELRAVLRHEADRDNRRTVVADIERRLARPAPTGQTTPARPAPTRKAAAKRAPRKAATRTTEEAGANHRFPIEGYDSLTVAQIRPRLAELGADQLRQVRERELAGASRKSVISEIDRRLR